MEWNRYAQELSNLLENVDMLNEIGFDLFDCNSDNKISEMDVMKLVQTFDRGPARERFGEVLYSDICQIQRRLNKQQVQRDADNVEKNEGDELFAQRALGFRNLQRLDKNFMKRKEKILWPLFEFKRRNNEIDPAVAESVRHSASSRGSKKTAGA